VVFAGGSGCARRAMGVNGSRAWETLSGVLDSAHPRIHNSKQP
jgi:hypothetical protein